MKKRIMTLMLGMLLLLTACGQTGSNSASKMMPVAAVQSAAQTIAPVEDTVQEDVDFLPAEEGVEEVKGADDKETPNPAEDADTPSAKTEETSTHPLKRHRPLHRKSRQYPRLCRRINLLPHPRRHLHRNRQRRNRKNLRPNLHPRLSLPPAGTSTPSRRLSKRATSTQERSTA